MTVETSVDPSLEADLAAGLRDEQLIPADLAGLSAASATLRRHSQILDEGAGSLSRVDATDWRGAASDGFHEVIDVQPGRWRIAADAFVDAATAIDGYAASIPPARSVASQAREVYRRYVAALAMASTAGGALAVAASARSAGTALVSVPGRMAIGARIEQMQAIGAGGVVRPSVGGGTSVVDVNAVDAMRREAIALLDQARRQVMAAGDPAADALTAAMAEAPAARRFWEQNIRPAAIVDTGHTVLDGAGMIPVIGDPADAVNGVWYLKDGDWANAGLSAIGLVPIVGEFVIAGKFGEATVRDGVLIGGPEAAARVSKHMLRELGDGGLLAHELLPDFHTIERHVGLSDTDLASRFVGNPNLRVASTFATLEKAEHYTYANLSLHGDDVNRWLGSQEPRLRLMSSFDHGVGRSLIRRSGQTVDASAVITFIRRDPSMATGYRIVTSYPD